MDVELDIEVDNIQLVKKGGCEFLGTMMLVVSIVGSGIMGTELSNDNAVILLGNTLSTIGMLYNMINIFEKISGSHFNPLVSLMFYKENKLSRKNLSVYCISQILGGISGTMISHILFNKNIINFNGKNRNSLGEFLSEILSTIILLSVIKGSIYNKKEVSSSVSLYIMSGYWCTLSTCFANPAVTIARSFTGTFSGISLISLPIYLSGQIIGLFIALPINNYIFYSNN